MSKKGLMFQDEKMDYDEFLSVIKEALEEDVFFVTKVNMESGINALTNINDLEKRKRLMDISLVIDEKTMEHQLAKKDYGRKIPFLMYMATLFDKNYEDIKGLNDEQLFVLGDINFSVQYSETAKFLGVIGNSELLQTIMDKTEKEEEREQIVGIIEDKFIESSIDKNDKMALNNFKNQMITMINSHTKEEFFKMGVPIIDRIIEIEKDTMK